MATIKDRNKGPVTQETVTPAAKEKAKQEEQKNSTLPVHRIPAEPTPSLGAVRTIDKRKGTPPRPR